MVFKISIAYFSNMCLIILISNLIIFDTFEFRIWNSAGIASNIMIIMLYTVISDIFFSIFDPFLLYKKY